MLSLSQILYFFEKKLFCDIHELENITDLKQGIFLWMHYIVLFTAIYSKGMNVIAMFKKISRIKYPYRGKQLNIKEICSQNKMRRVKSKFSS